MEFGGFEGSIVGVFGFGEGFIFSHSLAHTLSLAYLVMRSYYDLWDFEVCCFLGESLG